MVRTKNRAPVNARHNPTFPQPPQPEEEFEYPLYVPPPPPPKMPYHYLTKLMRTLIIVMYAMRYQHESLGSDDVASWIQLCRRDFEACPGCFEKDFQDLQCWTFENRVKIDQSFSADLVSAFQTHRRMRYATFFKKPAIIKHRLNKDVIMSLRDAVCESADDFVMDCDSEWTQAPDTLKLANILIKYYIASSRPGNVRVLPSNSVARFIEVFGKHYKNPLLPVVQLNMNPEAMVMRTMYAAKLPVPKVMLECGFLNVQSFDGQPLADFYSHSFYTRLEIARNIMDAVLKFNFGIDDFRIYLTDATRDNIAVNKDTLKVSFIDLDSVVIVDSKVNPYSNVTHPIESKRWQTVHRHEHQPCLGCFMYSEEDLMQHYLSDHNVYAICSLFVQDIYGNKENGLLHTIPASVRNNMKTFDFLLHQCMMCGHDCRNRFELSRQIVKVFTLIVEHK